MKIAHSWLSQWVKADLSLERISEILTDIGLEVEGVETVNKIPGGLEGLVVGEVLTCDQHPNADRLSLTTVNIGLEESLQIVCGAPNVSTGQKVIVATVGTVLYPLEGDSFKIKKGKIRGEVSQGMICAEDEIGLGNGHEGIMVLDENAVAGTPAAIHFNLEADHIIEIGLTPNRTDAMSHRGVARDLHAALLHLQESKSELLDVPNDFKPGNDQPSIDVKVDDGASCPKYIGLSIHNVKVKESPDWLKERLISIGLAPKNNIVDITNFVMHDLGQPLHAFDSNQISGSIRIGHLPANTKFKSLDEVERELHDNDLMICDDKGGLCIAGVFGGINSGVNESTTSVFLESAYFNPVMVRTTARRHGLNTDASFRFERGVDPEMTELALLRAAELICELGETSCTESMVLVEDTSVLPKTAEINLLWNDIKRLIGIEVQKGTCKNILASLDFKVLDEDEQGLKLAAPRYRTDVTRPADVIEEILRIYGFNQVPTPVHLKAALSYEQKPNRERYKERISQNLTARGAMEMMSNSLTSSAYLQLMPDPEKSESSVVKMLNPLSSDLGIMRQSLVFQGLEAVARNRNHKNADLFMYEFGKVYNKYESGYHEEEHLAIYLSGRANELNWNNTDQQAGPAEAKSAAYAVFSSLGWSDDIKEKNVSHPFFSVALDFQFRKKTLGTVGKINSKLMKHFGIDAPVWCVTLNWELMFGMVNSKNLKAKGLAKFPAVRRDLSLLVDEAITFSDLKNTAFQAERNLLKEVGLFDVYEGDKMKDGKKSYAINLTLQDSEKTLNDQIIDKSIEKITNALHKNHGAILRS